LIYSLGKINLLVLIFNHPQVGPYHPDSAGRSDANPMSNFVSYCSPKDDNEFGIVRENVKKHLEAVCSKVEEEFHKRVIKQARVQHLYTRLVGQLKNKSSEFDLMMKLHPTPAVCGHPQALAKFAISMSESFDRGMYAGPVGWFGGDGAEFAVGIRSSLKQGCL
jgi:menaquinone-specific isochorismate synthase